MAGEGAGRILYANKSLGAGDFRIAATLTLARLEGIIPALESSHAVAQAMKEAAKRERDQIILVCLSGRGDKDLAHAIAHLGGI